MTPKSEINSQNFPKGKVKETRRKFEGPEQQFSPSPAGVHDIYTTENVATESSVPLSKNAAGTVVRKDKVKDTVSAYEDAISASKLKSALLKKPSSDLATGMKRVVPKEVLPIKPLPEIPAEPATQSRIAQFNSFVSWLNTAISENIADIRQSDIPAHRRNSQAVLEEKMEVISNQISENLSDLRNYFTASIPGLSLPSAEEQSRYNQLFKEGTPSRPVPEQIRPVAPAEQQQLLDKKSETRLEIGEQIRLADIAQLQKLKDRAPRDMKKYEPDPSLTTTYASIDNVEGNNPMRRSSEKQQLNDTEVDMGTAYRAKSDKFNGLNDEEVRAKLREVHKLQQEYNDLKTRYQHALSSLLTSEDTKIRSDRMQAFKKPSDERLSSRSSAVLAAHPQELSMSALYSNKENFSVENKNTADDHAQQKRQDQRQKLKDDYLKQGAQKILKYEHNDTTERLNIYKNSKNTLASRSHSHLKVEQKTQNFAQQQEMPLKSSERIDSIYSRNQPSKSLYHDNPLRQDKKHNNKPS